MRSTSTRAPRPDEVAGKFSLSPRGEIFDDAAGFSTGRQANGQGRNDHFVGRLEYRHDASNAPYFDRGAHMAFAKDQSTLTVAVMAVVGPLK